ncbi:uncharacterized protein LOC115703563 [Cannabis sativa]|uniref:PLAC8 family protein n=1 Tax=Cannabis sativa TaxID=3483 RepID=A0A7J6FER0_CANSA|nr:uncharacterized protein LOC115703563 [Cannabis sativa]KAF4369186.1 hypothetical protein F8388_023050 [Cannabis sativa]KAF4397804.1 hypothetical protein G4B88_017285 [Cannabis sativa]
MSLVDNGTRKEEIELSGGNKDKGQAPLDISASRRTLLSGDKPQKKLNNTSTAIPQKRNFLKFGSASAKFRRMANEKDEISRSVNSSSSHDFKERISGVFSRKIDWVSVKKMCKEWFKDPMNMALFLWIFIVAVSGAILFLVMTGMLNKVITKKSQRDVWFEVNNQILNALFTLMCLYQHPKRIYHLVLLSRWKPKDITKLRKLYCKNGTYKPHEWAHMMVVVLLLHLNCFAQYALCSLNWGYKRSERPPLGVGVCISVAIAAPAIAGLYLIVSPLGKDYDSGMDEEAQVQSSAAERPEKLRLKSFERRFSFAPVEDEQNVESKLNWSGGILDFWNDISVAYLSLFCTCCVFGWNMERLGFGNMYVHIATFLLFCIAPFFIFNLAAVNIDNEAVREVLGVTGLVLCVFGLLYGGFWRIQMRKRFNLPSYDFCFGHSALGDCTLWLCCCWCTLAQEVRTGNSYDIVEDKLCIKHTDNDSEPPISPLPREDGVVEFRSANSSPLGNSSSPTKINLAVSSTSNIVSKTYYSPERPVSVLNEEFCEKSNDETMIPPDPPLIQREAT